MLHGPNPKLGKVKEFDVNEPQKAEQEFPDITLNELIDRYEKTELGKLGKRTQVDYGRMLGQLRVRFGTRLAASIKPRDVAQIMDVEKGKIAANRLAAVLSAVYTRAVNRWYLVEHNPCIGVERNSSPPRDRYVTDEEYKAVYNIASERMQIAMDMALLTAQRQGDLIDLKWTDVQTIGVPRDKWGIFFCQQKTGRRLLVNITPALEEVLKRARKMTPQIPRNFVLRTEDGLKYTRDGFRTNWQRMMNTALRKGLIKKRFTFHDLRAKSVSDSATLDEAFERAGHTSMAMTRGVYDRGIRRVSALR